MATGPSRRSARSVGSLLRPKELLMARADRLRGVSRPPRCVASRTKRSGKRSRCRKTLAAGRHRRLVSPHRRIMAFKYALGARRSSMRCQGAVPGAGDDLIRIRCYSIAGRLGLDHTIFGEDFSFLKSATRATAKHTSPREHDALPGRKRHRSQRLSDVESSSRISPRLSA